MARIAWPLPVSEEGGDEPVEVGLLVAPDAEGLTVLVTTVLSGSAVTQTVLNTVLVSVTCEDASEVGDWVATGSWSIGGTEVVATSTIDGIGGGAFGFEFIDTETRKFSLSTSTYSPPPSGGDAVCVGGET